MLVSNVDLIETQRLRDGTGARSAGAVVEAAVRDVLGYRAKRTDTKGFVTALQRSFTCKEVAGHTECEWTPRSYAATIQADLGAITGAQASIYQRAKLAVDAALGLLAGLEPLTATPDDQDVEAIRAIVRLRLTRIVAELGVEGGPRVQVVDELLGNLVGVPIATLNATTIATLIATLTAFNVAGELGLLRTRFGMDRDLVNTLGEEEGFTNFLIIADHVLTLFRTWLADRDFFQRGLSLNGDMAPFLGIQLVLLSRQLNVITETVRETYFAMDSVFLGAAERQTLLLELRFQPEDRDSGPLQDQPRRESTSGQAPPEETSIFLSDLLDWVYRFAAEEGPQLIEVAGTDGVNAFEPTIRQLALLVEAALLNDVDGTATEIVLNPEALPPSYRTERVQLALEQLASQLRQAVDLAEAVLDHLGLADEQMNPPNRSITRRGGGRR